MLLLPVVRFDGAGAPVDLPARAGGVATEPPAGPIAGTTGRQSTATPITHVWIAYVGTVVLVLVVGLPTLILPFWPDQAIFSMIGKSIGEGGFPYVDAWDQKPPSIYFIYTIAIRGPLGVMQNVRVFDLAWTAATVLVLVELGRRWWDLRAGVIAGLGFGVVYFTMSSGWARLAQPDSFIGLPLALALLLYDASRGRRSFLIVAGVLLGFAFQLRFIMALLVPFVPMVELATSPPSERVRLWLRQMIWLGVGFVAFQIVLLTYLQAGGALGEYVDATRFASGYTRDVWPLQGADGPTLDEYFHSLRFGFWGWARERLVLTGPAAIGGVIGVFLLRERRVQQLVIFTALAYAGIAIQARFFAYHYTYTLPFLALLSGWTWDQFLRLLERSRTRARARASVFVVVIGLLLVSPEVWDNGRRQWRVYVDFYRQPETRTAFDGSFEGFRDSRELAFELRRRTQPGDYLYVWGFDPLIYLLADRPAASRFIYSTAMLYDWSPPVWQSEFIEELRTRAPVYIVAQSNQSDSASSGASFNPIDRIAYGPFPALLEWLATHYEFEEEKYGYLVFRRRE
jgi:hypothetical protein